MPSANTSSLLGQSEHRSTVQREGHRGVHASLMNKPLGMHRMDEGRSERDCMVTS